MRLAIIQCRLDSKRLPGKALMPIAGKPLIKHVIDRVWNKDWNGDINKKPIKSIQGVIVATSQGGNGLLAARCEEWGVPFFQWDGDVNNVLGRFVACVKAYRMPGEPEPVDHVLRVCGDNPLFDPMSADELMAEAVIYGADYTGYSIGNKPAITIPNGYFGEVISVKALIRANDELPMNAPEREHVTACMYAAAPSRFTKPFTCRLIDAPAWYAKEKLKNAAVDTLEDFKRVREVMEKE